MNLIEAVKSGRRFKRPDWHGMWRVDFADTEYTFPLTADDILADDYEVEELEVTITSSTFDKAANKVREELFYKENDVLGAYLPILKKELGL